MDAVRLGHAEHLGEHRPGALDHDVEPAVLSALLAAGKTLDATIEPALCNPPERPNAPPISAPEVPMLTLAMPQSDPSCERKISAV